MANNQTTRREGLDAVFSALADPTRRAVVHRLGRGPASIGELARDFPMALPSFMKHIRVLEASGIVRTRKSGRVRSCELRTRRLDLVDHWLSEQRRLWNDHGDRLAAFAEAEAAAEAAAEAEAEAEAKTVSTTPSALPAPILEEPS